MTHSLTDLLTGVKCRATSVAKNSFTIDRKLAVVSAEQTSKSMNENWDMRSSKQFMSVLKINFFSDEVKV